MTGVTWRDGSPGPRERSWPNKSKFSLHLGPNFVSFGLGIKQTLDHYDLAKADAQHNDDLEKRPSIYLEIVLFGYVSITGFV